MSLRGRCSGTTQRRLGRLELAEGDAILLDEIAEPPAETEIALLRVLQEHEFEHVGGAGSIRSCPAAVPLSVPGSHANRLFEFANPKLKMFG
jgi:transcriptional regulator with AAA-type ATPase domain